MTLTDAVRVLGFLFLGQRPPDCLEAADFENDGAMAVTDAIGLLEHLFRGGPPPARPGPVEEACGADPDPLGSPADLGCEAYGSC